MNLRKLLIVFSVVLVACSNEDKKTSTEQIDTATAEVKPLTIEERLNQYASFTLNTDLSNFTQNEKKMLGYLIDACSVIDEIYWLQNYGNKDTLFAKLKDEKEKEYCLINYGPWDKLNDNEPFIEGVGKKPLGASFYPHDIKYFPFIDMKFEDKLSMYTVIKRGEDGSLYTEPYHIAYKDYLEKAANYLRKAAEFSPDKNFSKFLIKRAESLLTDDYYSSDIIWVDLNSKYDIVIGPYESEDDRFINTKTAYEGFVLIKDMEWSKNFKEYSKYLPEIKQSFNLDEKYKNQIHLANTNIGVFDAIYYAGWPNAGPKQISTNRPKDGRILMEKGSRKLQFKNTMKAKFDKILKPITDLLLDSSQRNNVKFEGFFINNVSYEIADAIMIKTTVNNKGPVKDALKDYYPTINSLKADILNMYILTKLQEKGVIKEITLLDNYVIFLSNIIRSVRFGAAFSQGSSNLMAFNMLQKQNAFERTENGTYKVNFERMKEVINRLSKEILTVLCEGDYATAKSWVEIYGNMSPELQKDIQKISKSGIPVDIKFEQGKKILGLE